ncbi:hypothetical protein [Periweissella cryptocerci]|nr:hypothetical protein [Periweissella cryptocerci]
MLKQEMREAIISLINNPVVTNVTRNGFMKVKRNYSEINEWFSRNYGITVIHWSVPTTTVEAYRLSNRRIDSLNVTGRQYLTTKAEVQAFLTFLQALIDKPLNEVFVVNERSTGAQQNIVEDTMLMRNDDIFFKEKDVVIAAKYAETLGLIEKDFSGIGYQSTGLVARYADYLLKQVNVNTVEHVTANTPFYISVPQNLRQGKSSSDLSRLRRHLLFNRFEDTTTNDGKSHLLYENAAEKAVKRFILTPFTKDLGLPVTVTREAAFVGNILVPDTNRVPQIPAFRIWVFNKLKGQANGETKHLQTYYLLENFVMELQAVIKDNKVNLNNDNQHVRNLVKELQRSNIIHIDDGAVFIHPEAWLLAAKFQDEHDRIDFNNEGVVTEPE